MSRSMRGKGTEKRLYSSNRGRTSEDFSTSVESSASRERRLLPAGEALSWRKKPSRTSSAGNCKRRGLGNSTFEIGSHDDKGWDYDDNDPTIQPDMEAYCRGSWWDAKVLARDGVSYLIHYETFSVDDDEWVPIGHLRLRSRLTKVEDCQNVLEPGIDVCVMANHPQANSLPAWYDAQIVDIEKKHTLKRCHCIFKVQLYTIPKVLPRDYQLRTLLTGPPCREELSSMSVMRGANNMPFQQVVTAALPNSKNNIKRKWAKDVTLWYSSLVSANTFKERSFSLESRVAGGSIIPPEPMILRPFEAFLEEEGLKKKEPDTWSSLGEQEDDHVPLSALLTPRKTQVPSCSKSGKKPKDVLASARVPNSPGLTPRDESKSRSEVFGSKTKIVSEDDVVRLASRHSPVLTPPRDGFKGQNAISGIEARRLSEDDLIPSEPHSSPVPISQEELKSQAAISGLQTRRKPDDSVPFLVPRSPVLTLQDGLESWSEFSGLKNLRKPGDGVMPTQMPRFPGFTAQDGLTCQFALPGSETDKKLVDDVIPLFINSSPVLIPQDKLNPEFAISGSESKSKPGDDLVIVTVQSSPHLTPQGGAKIQTAFSGSETKRKLEGELTPLPVQRIPGLTPQDVLRSLAGHTSTWGGKAQDDKGLSPVRSSQLLPEQVDSKVQVAVSGSKNRPIVLDVDDDKDAGEYCSKRITSTSGFTCLDRFSSEDRPTSPESLEDNVGEAPDVATSSESSEDSRDLLHDLIMSELFPSKLRVHHNKLGKPNKVASKNTVPVTSSENSDPDDFAKYLEQEISLGPVKRHCPQSAKTMKQTPKFPLSWPVRVTKLKDGNYNRKISWKKIRTGTSEMEVLGSLVPLKPHKQKAGEEIKSIEMMGLEDFADGLEDILVAESPVVSELIARSKEKNKAGLTSQVIRSKQKRQRSEGISIVVKPIKKEVTYADLFKAEEKEPETTQIATNDKSADRGGSVLPSWNPLMEHWGPDPKLEMKKKPILSDEWEDMRVAMEPSEAASEVGQEKETEKAKNLAEENKCYNQDGTKNDKEHIFYFRPEAGLVCQVCGLVGLKIENMWERDHPKRLHNPKEASDDDYESDHSGMGLSWDSDYDRPTKLDSSKEGSIFDEIPHLERHMQKHQKEGFEFLWRNLAGLDSRRQPFWPLREPGGCVLSHAPGTGKSFLVISFLQSYMKVNQKCRPLIVAPKIMLQPWEKEFRKWNVDIPVFIFNQAEEVLGRQLFQQHEEGGDIQLKTGAKLSVRRSKDVYRQAMLWQWHKQPSVLVISYGLLTALIDKEHPSEERKVIRKQLLERSNILILDEGHFARNKNAKVRKALMLVQTQLRILLSGTLFQNNFEELFTTLNLVRSGFVNAFAKSDGLSTEIQDMETRGDGKETANLAILDGVAKVAETRARKLFIEEIGNKIDRGQRTQAYSESLARGLEQLQKLTSPFVHHYTGDILRSLPPLRDFAILLQPTDLQEKMLKNLVVRLVSKTMLEQEIIMSLVCIHPVLFIDSRIGQLLPDLLSPQEMKGVTTNRDPSEGVKTRFVINLLKLLQNGVLGGHEKLLVFSQNLRPLDLLEAMMNTSFGWAKERDFLQLDGSHNSSERQSIIEQFNDPTGGVRVLLASTKACGEGITLTGASRVVFMDVLWNPAVIRQAISRAFRLGQTKIVYVYRLVASGSFEERKYRKMVYKDWMSRAIFNSSVEGAEHGDKSLTEGRGPPKHFWEITGDSSKDAMLKELLRQDYTSGFHAFKRMFRHEGFFDDDYDNEPGGKGMDATDWLHGEEGSFDLSDHETDNDSCERDINDCDNLDEE